MSELPIIRQAQRDLEAGDVPILVALVLERDITSMALRHRTGDGETEADTARLGYEQSLRAGRDGVGG